MKQISETAPVSNSSSPRTKTTFIAINNPLRQRVLRKIPPITCANTAERVILNATTNFPQFTAPFLRLKHSRERSDPVTARPRHTSVDRMTYFVQYAPNGLNGEPRSIVPMASTAIVEGEIRE